MRARVRARWLGQGHGLEATKPNQGVKGPPTLWHSGAFPKFHLVEPWATLGPGSALTPSVTLDESFIVSGPWKTELDHL